MKILSSISMRPFAIAMLNNQRVYVLMFCVCIGILYLSILSTNINQLNLADFRSRCCFWLGMLQQWCVFQSANSVMNLHHPQTNWVYHLNDHHFFGYPMFRQSLTKPGFTSTGSWVHQRWLRSGNLLHSYWTWPFIDIYSGFTHWK